MLHEDVTEQVIASAMKVHTALGAGLLESAYDVCLFHELTLSGLHFEHHLALPVIYGTVRLDGGYRIDFLVEDCVIVEVKAVRRLRRLHQAQILSYQKATGCRVGLLMNFNVRMMVEGLQRFIR